MTVYRKSSLGVNSIHVNHHIIPTLLEDKSDIITVHVGINDVLNRYTKTKLTKIFSRYTSHAKTLISFKL